MEPKTAKMLEDVMVGMDNDQISDPLLSRAVRELAEVFKPNIAEMLQSCASKRLRDRGEKIGKSFDEMKQALHIVACAANSPETAAAQRKLRDYFRPELASY